MNNIQDPNISSRKKTYSVQSFDGCICLHVGENQVEEDRHGEEEEKLYPQRDEAGLLWLLSCLTGLHRSRSQRGVAERGRSVVHVGPGKHRSHV